MLLLLPRDTETPDNPRGVEHGLLRIYVQSVDDARQEIRSKNVTIFAIDDRLSFHSSSIPIGPDHLLQPDFDVHTDLYHLLLPTLIKNSPSLILNLDLRQIEVPSEPFHQSDGEYNMVSMVPLFIVVMVLMICLIVVLIRASRRVESDGMRWS